MIGSEGILGVITQAWMRLQDPPKFRDGGAVRFRDFFSAARAVRAISQAGLYPSNCRILDPSEAYNTGAADGSVAIMVLGFESADHDVAPWMKRAREMLRGSWWHSRGDRRRGAPRGQFVRAFACSIVQLKH
jgi:alkyldihydroxyacetonephosphate synthase